jgi:type IV pilus assembly protein PilV
MKYRQPIIRSAGFSLVEVMVALIVISVGLLGIAKMQALALSNTSSARLRSLAAIEAASLASTMRADRAYWAVALAPPTTTTIQQGAVVATDAALQAAVTAAAGAGTGSTNSYCLDAGANSVAPCTPVQLAGSDLQVWAGDMNALMPNAITTVNCQVGAPLTCQLQIQWTENSVNVNKQAAGGNTSLMTSSNYVLDVQP